MSKAGTLIFILLFGWHICAFAQDDQKAEVLEVQETAMPEAVIEAPESSEPQAAVEAPQSATEKETAVVDNLAVSPTVTLDFKDADIRNVLKIISYKSGVNIVATPEVIGNISIRLVEVPWENALDVILKTYGFGYERKGNIITVAPLDKLTAQKKQEIELAQVQPTITEVFNLKYLDAQDAKKALDPQLSPRGKITVLEMTGQAGWEFAGGESTGKRKRSAEEKMGRSKVLIVSDVPPIIEKVREVVAKLDVKPQQILIQTRIIEVDRNKLRDIGFDWGTGTAGAETSAVTNNTLTTQGGKAQTSLGGHNLSSQVKPSGFNPMAGALVSGVEPYNIGLELLFKKLTGPQFEVIIHALEEDVHTNTLSAPRIMTLNNQEAAILVNTRYPILKQEQTATATTPITTESLDYYQDIGIQLNVVPQIAGDNAINMVIHPAVTSYTDTLGVNAYPIIQNREAETRILMRDNETVVIGGLMKDVKTKAVEGIPFLKDIPYIGKAFSRETYDTEKVELLIFITASIVKDEDSSLENIAKIEEAITANNPLAPRKK